MRLVAPFVDRADDPVLLRRRSRRCLDYLSFDGVDCTLDRASRAHVA